MQFALTTVLLILLLPPLFVYGAKLIARARKLRQTFKLGYVRVFYGPCDWNDHSDTALQELINSRLLDGQAYRYVTLELFPHLDEVYAVNGIAANARVKLRLTHGATRPENTLVLDFPKSWGSEESGLRLERRRPSEDELNELHQYKALQPRQLLRFVVSGLFTSLGALYLLMLLLDHLYTIDPQATTMLSNPANRFRFAMMTAIPGIALIAYRIHIVQRFAALIQSDIDFNWIVMIGPEVLAPQAEHNPLTIIERLPVSQLIWTIGGKPAGWRRYKSHKPASAR